MALQSAEAMLAMRPYLESLATAAFSDPQATTETQALESWSLHQDWVRLV